jgi:hypothetical protein
MSQTIALLGAGGKMGCRITDRIGDDPAYDVRYVEPAPGGRKRLREHGVEETTPSEEAVPGADVVVMAVPDERIGEIAGSVVPQMDDGALLVLLDPAAAYAGVLPDSDGVSYFVTHPCHPSFFTAEASMDDPDTDWFGGQGRDVQDVVCALHEGPEEAYARGEAIARDIYGPVRTAHRVTTEQMAILEPALSETLAGACLAVIRDGLDRAVEMGVPEEAARAFLFGHLRIDMGIIFGFTDFPFSDGAQTAIETAKQELFVEDWEDRVFDLENVEESATEIATPSE